MSAQEQHIAGVDKSVRQPEKSDRFDVLLDKVSEYLDPDEMRTITDAYEFAKKSHNGQFRKSGEPYIMHPVEVAIILSELHMDVDTLCAALLHDTVEDTDVTLDDLTKRFNATVAELVDGVTKINKIEVESLSEAQVRTLRKMLVAMSRDIRVIVYDGKMHPVDSNEISFKLAARNAFKEAFRNAGPKIMEPIYDVEVLTPSDYMGAVMSDLQNRRAMIMGMESDKGFDRLNARVPLAELYRYSTTLSSLSSGAATYTMKFASYEQVPADVQDKLLKAYTDTDEE